MRVRLREAFRAELTAARRAEAAGALDEAWSRLERAHVLSQAHAAAHVHVHLSMAAFTFRRRDLAELLGQIPRILLAVPGSLTGRAPRGNTGGADVGIFTPMPIPPDLGRWLEQRPEDEAR